MTTGMIGRKVGMMTLYDGAGVARGVTVVELGPNPVTQLRTQDRDGYEAVQVGFNGKRKRLTRPERGHLEAAGVAQQSLSELREFRVDSTEEYALGQVITVEQFEPGSFVDVTATSKGRGFAGGVRRWSFRGGPKTHGQSDRWRAPGSIGAGTTPGRVWKGQKMAGHMGAATSTVRNLLVVAIDPSRHLIFVEGSVPGARNGVVVVQPGVREPLADFVAAEIAPAATPMVVEEPEPETPVADEAVEETEATEAAAASEEAPEAEAADEAPEASMADAEESDEVVEDATDDEPAAEAPDETPDDETDEERDE